MLTVASVIRRRLRFACTACYCLLLALAVRAGSALAQDLPSTVFVLNSEPRDFIGGGHYYYYTPGDGAFYASKNRRNGVTVTFNGSGPVGGGHYWSAQFAAPGNALLVAGTYTGAVSFYARNAAGQDVFDAPGLNVGGDGRSTSSLSGSFTIHEIVYGEGSQIVRFHASFTQIDQTFQDTAGPALRGEVMFNASAPRPPDRTAEHPPEELLVAGYTGALWYRPDGTPVSKTSVGGYARAIAFDHRGNYYLGGGGKQQNPPRIFGYFRRVPADGKNPTEIPGNRDINALATDRSGNVFAVEAGWTEHTIWKITPALKETVVASGLGSVAALACDGAGNLYAADNSTHAIYRFTPAGEKTLFFSGLGDVRSLAFDRAGNLLVVDRSARAVFRLSAEGTLTTFSAGYVEPISICVNNLGEIFVGDRDPHTVSNRAHSGRVYKVSPSGAKTQFLDIEDSPVLLAFAPHPVVVPVNLSTRANVGTEQSVLISGLIVSGPAPKKVVIRGIGPSLARAGVATPLLDPVLELHDGTGALIAKNDNWRDIFDPEIGWSGVAPEDNREAALVRVLPPGTYTAVLSGKGDAVGTGLLEVYDLDPTATVKLANVSSRSVMNDADAVMIAGFMLSGGTTSCDVAIRAIGPSLVDAGITRPLADPTLELRDAEGQLIASNDDWQQTQEVELRAAGLAPRDATEAAIIQNLSAGIYTAVVRSKAGSTGVGVVEVYHLENR